MSARLEVYIKEDLVDAAGDGLLKDIEDLNIAGAKFCRFIRVTELEGKLSKSEINRIGRELLADPVSQKFSTGKTGGALTKGAWVVEVHYNHGVTDPVSESTLKGISDMGIKGVTAARTATKVVLRGKLSKSDVDAICRRLLANSVIQTFTIEKN